MNYDPNQILIIPRVHIGLEQSTSRNQWQEPELIQNTIPMSWNLDGMDFRLDISLPDSGTLEIIFPMEMERLHINGEVVWKHSEQGSELHSNPLVRVCSLEPTGLQLTYASGGALHILATFPAKAN